VADLAEHGSLVLLQGAKRARPMAAR
jgi:hypothetical protein